MFVRWQNAVSALFSSANGERLDGILSLILFRFYICDLIDKITKMNVGCLFAGRSINLLAYADDMVLLAPSWRALQSLLVTIESAAGAIDMSFNAKKTVCMVFNPCDRHKIVCNSFPVFTLADCKLLLVDSFKYLGHIIDNTMCDDKDIHRELKSLFTRTNMLARRFKRCSTQVKVKLFRSYCICMYDIALWNNYAVASMNKLASSYIKCIKLFFRYSKYCSVTNMLLDLGLPSFNTLVHNYKVYCC